MINKKIELNRNTILYIQSIVLILSICIIPLSILILVKIQNDQEKMVIFLFVIFLIMINIYYSFLNYIYVDGKYFYIKNIYRTKKMESSSYCHMVKYLLYRYVIGIKFKRRSYWFSPKSEDMLRGIDIENKLHIEITKIIKD